LELDFISYLDENGEKKDSNVEIVSISDGFVKFRTVQNNYITIPSHRILKIKERREKIEERDQDGKHTST
jgi:uncharacterized protein (UPF0248 family)